MSTTMVLYTVSLRKKKLLTFDPCLPGGPCNKKKYNHYNKSAFLNHSLHCTCNNGHPGTPPCPSYSLCIH